MELTELLSQEVFERPVGEVWCELKKREIPVHKIVLSDTNDKPIAAVIFITHSETAQEVIACLDAMDAKETA